MQAGLKGMRRARMEWSGPRIKILFGIVCMCMCLVKVHAFAPLLGGLPRRLAWRHESFLGGKSRAVHASMLNAVRMQQLKDDDTSGKAGTQWSLKSTESASTPSKIDKRPDEGMPPLDETTRALNGVVISVLKGAIDILYKGRDYQRFFVLETVARVPYFSYMSVLHLYETMGLHRKANWIKVHYAEADNELHHLLIMEALGGSKEAFDRVFAISAAFAYYWFVIVVYIFNPRGAYHLSQLIEDHAYNTYSKFLKDNEAELKAAPAPKVALDYYHGTDYYMFDAFHTALSHEPRRPDIKNLYDVFACIRDDEGEHRASLAQLVDCGQICARYCTPSPACGVYADQCDVDLIPTARGQGTSYINMKDYKK